MPTSEQNPLCPFHGSETNIRPIHKAERKIFGDAFGGKRGRSAKVVFYHIMECEVCHAPLIYYSEDSNVVNFDIDELVFPEFDSLHISVPKPVIRYYQKALFRMNNDTDAFVNNIRKGLEAICSDRTAGSEPDPLATRLEKLVNKDNLPSLIWEMMDSLKNIGNFGSHANTKAEIKETHVPAVHMFFRGVIEYVYVVPFEIKKFRQELEKLRPSYPKRPTTIPLFNPRQEIAIIGDIGVYGTTRDVARSGLFVNGDQTPKFEENFAAVFRSSHAVAVSSGTSALKLMLQATGVNHTDKVVTSAHTYVAVLEAILSVGAEPVLIDIDPETWQMPVGDWPDDVVMVSHLYGGVSAAAGSNARLVFEDASQSLGAKLNSRFVGTVGRAGAVSLYPTKNLSAIGDAGIIITDDEDLAVRLRALRNHGQTNHQVHEYYGTTARMDEVQAAVLSKKIGYFKKFVTARRRAAKYYDDHLRELPLKLPIEPTGSRSVPNMYVIRSDKRDKLKQFLAKQGINTGIHYPTPFHLMPAYKDQKWAQISLPHTEQLSREILSLPLWVGISDDQLERVVKAISEFFEKGDH